ncbi:MAG: hypothetical protein IPJ34_00315 [Myxococcales bacterium]|nr:hypothetical protein [Myxococcales bacterium]
MAKTPSQIVKEKFGDKKKLVEAVQKFVGDALWVPRLNESKGLAHVSNAKLLRLLDTFTTVETKWGTRAKLIDAVIEAAGKTKDTGFRTSIEGWPVPRLLDAHQSYARRNGKAKTEAKPAEKKAAKAEAAPAKAAAKKAPAKAEEKPAAKKPAAKKPAAKK